MQVGLIAALLSAAALSGCATANGMGHGTMNHEEMMRHCQMMEQHQSQEGRDGAQHEGAQHEGAQHEGAQHEGGQHDGAQHEGGQHDNAQHGGMNHEEMARHCAMMREHQNGAQGASASSERLEAVAAAGAEIMPFDLERTTHSFLDRAWGGEQIVVSDDADAQQVALIRSHLSEQAAKFARGDFASPEAIHGQDMPGLAVLRDRYAQIEVSYAETPAGGTISYRSADGAALEALHAWFGAQRTDHGAHASH
jgi:hypothetical protein